MTTSNDQTKYPSHLITKHTLSDGTVITIRPTTPDDSTIIKEFGRSLSDELKHLNYMETFRDLPESIVNSLTNIDYKKTMAFIATYLENKKEVVVGMVHYVSVDGKSCEFDMIVADSWQNFGIGTILTEALIKAAKESGINSIKIIILSSNLGGMMLAKNFGFAIENTDEPTVKMVTRKI